ncbi:2-dehydro-3-deoxygluconokinase [Bacillus sp. FJAT-25509]|uniref:sugar kinase n=1 Tax=Bacillus sp. FJAT-25509 TaxID=1712029 RepID=UPI0006F614FA|nr:sugar kinase [Bacillus sp. FJAT-25509]KQL41794.1 2-dehydro-3-deoxygluconokinase [Bacillus sp. FJAT-25509]
MKKVVTLGEIMLRFSTFAGERLSQSGQLKLNYGGAEANVAISMAHFGYNAFFVSKIPDNQLGQAVGSHLRSHGVKTDYMVIGGERLGTYYLETGIGERSAHVTYDRKNSSFSMMNANEIKWDEIFKNASLFHVSGITLALSPELRESVLVGVKKAKQLSVKTSFDFNYRAKLWSQQEAREAILPLLPYIDICSFGELDAIFLLGLVEADQSLSQTQRLIHYYSKFTEIYPNIQFISSTFRNVISASTNQLQGNLFVQGELYQSKVHYIDPIVDRVGGGDAFAASILTGILEEYDPQEAVSFATAASALKHTIHGDCNLFTKEEVFRFAESAPGKIVR